MRSPMEQDPIGEGHQSSGSAGNATAIAGTTTEQKHLQIPRPLKQKSGYMMILYEWTRMLYGCFCTNKILSSLSGSTRTSNCLLLFLEQPPVNIVLLECRVWL